MLTHLSRRQAALPVCCPVAMLPGCLLTVLGVCTFQGQGAPCWSTPNLTTHVYAEDVSWNEWVDIQQLPAQEPGSTPHTIQGQDTDTHPEESSQLTVS